MLETKLPHITCVHAAELVVSLVFSDIAQLPVVKKLIKQSQYLYRHFTSVHVAATLLAKKSAAFNHGQQLRPDRCAGTRMASFFYGFHKDLRLKASYTAAISDPAYVECDW